MRGARKILFNWDESRTEETGLFNSVFLNTLARKWEHELGGGEGMANRQPRSCERFTCGLRLDFFEEICPKGKRRCGGSFMSTKKVLSNNWSLLQERVV